MQFSLQSSPDLNLVRACSAHEIRVREHVIRRSAVLTAEHIVFEWPPTRISELRAVHLQAVLALEPEIILLGTGERQIFPAAEIRSAVQHAGVGFEVMDTRAACRTYNVLVQEGRRVAAALIIGDTPPPD
ncbi:MAG TPA: Mth938-like domain-containing protein [Steroidobacteraceae bacterium]|nr:Mth938-like domain-containing protein [Steroidobacteraceae bacterium]